VNNATLFTADRRTHAKIVVVALLASIAVCWLGIHVQVKPVGSESLHRATTGFVTAGVDNIAITILPTRIEQIPGKLED
jgi:hypothetical protein